MKHYAMMNAYATETSDGFANTWYPVRFASRAERDQAIAAGINAARPVMACERREVAKGAEDYSNISRRIVRL